MRSRAAYKLELVERDRLLKPGWWWWTWAPRPAAGRSGSARSWTAWSRGCQEEAAAGG